MPKQFEEREDPRRAFLVKALASGLLAAGGLLGSASRARAQLFGRKPGKLPAGQSIYEARGAVRINGRPAARDSLVGADAVIETGDGAQFIFVVGSDAFLMRENSRLELSGSNMLVNGLRLATGALLSVFGRGSKQVYAPTSTIGIRGTGLYVESAPDRAYVCTCYGETSIAAADDPSISEVIVSKHHDAPRYVYAAGAPQRIVPAPFVNHDDLELMLIESLVGRTPPFSLFDEGYGSPRRY